MPLKKPGPTESQMAKFVLLCEQDPTNAIQLLLWKDRHRNPDMSVEISARDVEQFRKCVDYLEAEPLVNIFQPGGAPAQKAQPAIGKRGPIPARAARPPREACVVQLVDANGNAITPVEDNDQDQAAGRAGKQVRTMRERAPMLANELINMLSRGDSSSALIEEACTTMRALAAA